MKILVLQGPNLNLVGVKSAQAGKRVTLDKIKATQDLGNMVLVNNSRLSVQPVSPKEWKIILQMGMEA